MPAQMFRPSKFSGLPDPARQPEFYRGVLSRRLLAFLLDSVFIGVATVVVLPFTAFLGLFFLPVLISVISFVYRFLTLASSSATCGMRITGIELRTHRGESLPAHIAALHVILYLLCLGTVVPTLLSLLSMVLTTRRQSLPDLVLGVAAIRTPG